MPWTGRAPGRHSDFGECFRRAVEVPADIDVKRRKALAVFARRREIAVAKKVVQVAEVPARQGEFGGRCAECGEPGLTIDRRHNGRCAVDQAGEVGTARKAGGVDLMVKAVGGGARDAD